MCTSAVFACNGWIPRVHAAPRKPTHETAVRFYAKIPECPLCLWWVAHSGGGELSLRCSVNMITCIYANLVYVAQNTRLGHAVRAVYFIGANS
jgi:hypothetical protein